MDSLNIIIKAILEKSSRTQIETDIKEIEKKLKPLEIKTDVDKVKSQFKILEDGSRELQKVVTNTSNTMGQQVQIIEKVNKVTKELVLDSENVTNNYKKQRDQLAKINAEQSKYWTQRRKETLDSMVGKPDTLVQMSNYYKNLEKESANLAKTEEKRQQVESRYWMERRKETLDSMTSTNTAIQQMKQYYAQLERETAEEGRQNTLIREQIALYQQEIAIKNKNLMTTYGKSYDSKGMTSIIASANSLNSNDYKTIDELKRATKQLDLEIASSTAGMRQLRREATYTAKEADGLFTTFGKDVFKLGIWALAASAVYSPLRAIKSAVSYISEMDNALNEVRIVTNKTQQEVNDLALSYNKLGKEMNVTTKELTQTAADLYRQGLNDTQVEERMKGIVEYAKISSISLEDSNRIITSTANATGESTQKIIDIFALLGDTTASGADEIGEALQRVASAADNSNVSLEKSASWIATISSITRESASTIGRSLDFGALVA
ncbi:MAG: phage tail tape measure protein [Clostridium sp.]|uniref:phage tail tape measure protein n=1 Tax=Clostridium sp. TaxID=1506 RepID=UPI0025BCFB77|nr:phage tail tape measure protein [Clostridium sp.]MCE5220063.1 phage tail tape measure protein [Clostridium sp.]